MTKALTKTRLRQLSQKYYGRAGNTLYGDGIMFKEAGMGREAQIAKEIHDLSYRLATLLEERAEK